MLDANINKRKEKSKRDQNNEPEKKEESPDRISSPAKSPAHFSRSPQQQTGKREFDEHGTAYEVTT